MRQDVKGQRSRLDRDYAVHRVRASIRRDAILIRTHRRRMVDDLAWDCEEGRGKLR
jgi:hypothetical protein